MIRVVVAICTWNRCELLRQTLEGMKALVVPADIAWEVLVINNNCTDATDAVVNEFTGTLPVRLVHEPAPGLSNARNRAMQECRGDYIVFTDDDVLVDSGWLEAFVEATRSWPGAAVFGGPVEPWFPVEPSPELFEAFPAIRNGFCGIDHHLPLGLLPERRRLTGANMAFRMSATAGLRFDPALGMTHTALGGGEETAFVEVIRTRGGAVVWAPDMRVRHYVDPARMQLGYLIRLARDRGRSKIREKGIPPGLRIVGTPVHLLRRLLAASTAAALAYVTGRRIRAAGHFARAESYRVRIWECWAVTREARAAQRSPDVVQ